MSSSILTLVFIGLALVSVYAVEWWYGLGRR